MACHPRVCMRMRNTKYCIVEVPSKQAFIKAVAIDTNLLVALRAIDLLLTPTPSRDHMFLYCPVSILKRYHNRVL